MTYAEKLHVEMIVNGLKASTLSLSRAIEELEKLTKEEPTTISFDEENGEVDSLMDSRNQNYEDDGLVQLDFDDEE